MDWTHLLFSILLDEVVFCRYEAEKGLEGVVMFFEGRCKRRRSGRHFKTV